MLGRGVVLGTRVLGELEAQALPAQHEAVLVRPSTRASNGSPSMRPVTRSPATAAALEQVGAAVEFDLQVRAGRAQAAASAVPSPSASATRSDARPR